MAKLPSGLLPAAPPALNDPLRSARSLLRARDLEGARRVLEDVLKIAPNDLMTRALYAHVCWRIGDHHRGIEVYESIWRAIPSASGPKLVLALALLRCGAAARARVLLEDVVMKEPENRRAWAYLGIAFEQLGRPHDAEFSFFLGGCVPSASASCEQRRMPRETRPYIPSEPRGPCDDEGDSIPTMPLPTIPRARTPRFEDTLPPPDLDRDMNRPATS